MQNGQKPRQLSEQELREDRDRFVAFAFTSADILMELDAKNRLIYVDGALFSMLGIRPDDVLKRSFLDLVPSEDQLAVQELLDSTNKQPRFSHLMTRLQNNEGKPRDFVIAGYKLPYMQQHTFITLSLMRQNIDPKELDKRDLRTGLLKQQAFSEKAAKAFQKASEEHERVTITLIDLPELAKGTVGPHVAEMDKLLAEICQYLQEISYGQDSAAVVGEGSFALLHDPSTNQQAITQKVREISAKHLKKEEFAMKSAEVDVHDCHLSDHDSARALLYTINKFAEHEGEEFTVTSLMDGYQNMLEETVQRITAFHQTLEDNAFKLALQPIVDLRSRKPHHFEVLTRLDSDETFSNPFDFITFGEQAGVIGDYDLAVCQRTVELLKKWKKQGKQPLISLNLSGNSISSDLFKDTLLEILRTNAPVRHQLIFEVTESAKINDLPKANEFLQILRKEGNLCCLDDFGVGESSFDYLRHLEVDYVKIDGSYVRDSLESPRGKHLLRAMVALCQDLNIKTIGEMVEDETVSQFLSSCGVTLGQGYYYGRPSTDIEQMIAKTPNVMAPATGYRETNKPVRFRSGSFRQ